MKKKTRAAAIAVHHTETTDTAWDAGAAEKALGDDPSAATIRGEYAWISDDAGDKPTKSDGKFPHHEAADGKVGDANTKGCSSGIGVLNGGRGGADIPDGDRQGVYDHLAAHIKDAGADVPKLESASEAVKHRIQTGIAKLTEAGRTLSAANEEKLRTALSNLQAVLDTIEPDGNGSDSEPADATEAAKRKIGEAYSASAWDASDGAYILAQLLSLISAESDEPDQVAMLTDAFNSVSKWIAAEVAEIATPEDQADSEGPAYWESLRALLPAGSTRIRESAARTRMTGDVVQLLEKAVSEDGTVPIKVIQPGWGAMGYYSAAVLERDGPKVFAAGTKQFWDHATLTEDIEQPERSLRDLAAVLVSDAHYEANGPAGPGLYAEAKVFSEFAPVIEELAPYIGVSISSYAFASQGEAEGKRGAIIERLIADPLNSIDYVTTPGAGGQVLQLFEAARQRQQTSRNQEVGMDPTIEAKLKEVEKERAADKLRADRLEEAIILRDAKDLVRVKLAAVTAVPDVTKVRLARSLVANPPVKDGQLDTEALGKAVDEAVKQEADYLAQAGAGRVRGFGLSKPGEDATDKELVGVFSRLGLSESAAKVAAQGRQ
jgi:hypothetical protein